MPTWDEFWGALDFLPVVGWVLGFLGVIAFIAKGWPRVRALVALIDSLAVLPKFMTDTTATLKAQDVKIAEIHHEVNYNNGSSVKDAISRVELGVKGLYDRADKADQADLDLRHDLEMTQPRTPKTPARKPRAPKKENP